MSFYFITASSSVRAAWLTNVVRTLVHEHVEVSQTRIVPLLACILRAGRCNLSRVKERVVLWVRVVRGRRDEDDVRGAERNEALVWPYYRSAALPVQ